jgi:DNA-binding transcriptional regulator of glucitol operon
MPYEWTLILAAVVAGWILQLILTYRQSVAFNADARALRRAGTVSIGVGGNRYRGGRAYVALAFDEGGVVRDAIVLSGWTTFARAKALPQVVGVKAGRLEGDRELDGVSAAQRKAARQAATLWREGTSSARRTPVALS